MVSDLKYKKNFKAKFCRTYKYKCGNGCDTLIITISWLLSFYHTSTLHWCLHIWSIRKIYEQSLGGLINIITVTGVTHIFLTSEWNIRKTYELFIYSIIWCNIFHKNKIFFLILISICPMTCGATYNSFTCWFLYSKHVFFDLQTIRIPSIFIGWN